MSYCLPNYFSPDFEAFNDKDSGVRSVNATLGLLDFPASLIACLLWQGLGTSAPIHFGALLAPIAAAMLFWIQTAVFASGE